MTAVAMTQSAVPGLDDGASNVLLISAKRPRLFYERAAKELFASGIESVHLSALGEAICTAVELAGILEEKNTALVEKIETKYQTRSALRKESNSPQSATPTFQDDANSQQLGESIKTPGIYIILKKHPQFKGSRITPGHVTWGCDLDKQKVVFSDASPSDVFSVVIPGNSSLGFTTDNSISGITGKLLSSPSCNSHELSAYSEAHRVALSRAYDALAEHLKTETTSPFRIVETLPEHFENSALKAVYCRPAVNMHPDGKDKPSCGAVFVDIFADGKTPYSHAKNYSLIYVVAPQRNDYQSEAEFFNAVRLTGENLMTALCDYNGMVRRREKSSGLKRLVTVRIFALPENQPNVDKNEIANQVLSGLNAEYHYGASPRLNFVDEEFKQAWTKQTGLDILDPATQNTTATPSS